MLEMIVDKQNFDAVALGDAVTIDLNGVSGTVRGGRYTVAEKAEILLGADSVGYRLKLSESGVAR